MRSLSKARLSAIREVLKGIGILALVVVPACYAGLMAPQADSVNLGASRQIQGESSGRQDGGSAASQPAQPVQPAQPALVGLPVLRSVPLIRINAPVAPDLPLQPRAVEQALLTQVNADRMAYGMNPVEYDPALLPLARARAADQLSRASLSHLDSVGTLAFAGLLSEAQLKFSRAGENLARLSDGPEVPGAAERALMNSPTHRRNILEPSFNRLAVGTTDPRDGKIALAQLFRAVDE
jgi:uncharacterized protein YkwD